MTKKIAEELNYDGIEFPIHEKDFSKIEICFDNKRYVLDDGIHSLNYFHKNSVKSCNN